LAGSVSLVILALAGWLEVRALRHPARAEPAEVPREVVSANVTALPIFEPSAPGERELPREAPTDVEADEFQPDVQMPPEAESPPAPPMAEVEQKPERIAAPAPFPLPAVPDKYAIRRRNNLSENDLRKKLALAPEFSLTPAVRQAMVATYQKDYQAHSRTSTLNEIDPYTLLKHFPKANQLPLRPAPLCQLGPNEAITLGVLARKLHAYLDLIAPMDGNGKREPARLREVLHQERRGKRPEWLRAEAVPAMVQILMAEDVPLRLILVDMLGEIDGKAGSIGLAQRAAFDLSPEVRLAAIQALRHRPRADSRQILVNALRYPWPPAADHAAEALVALEDRDAAPLIVAQLSKADPAAPYDIGKSGTAVREIVRVNHQANCLLCHAPATSGRNPVVGLDPITSRPIDPEAFANHYGSRGGALGQSLGAWQGVLIRADVQFVRQDFSVTFPLGQPFVEVQGQRFDFIVRTRPLKGAELREWKKLTPPPPTAYPQREAALFALRYLTGQDVGPTTEAWAQLYPNANAEAEGVRISSALLKSTADQRDQMIVRYREGKDERYTDGLAYAIPLLKGKLQVRVREALVERLSRLPVESLRDRLEDDHPELHQAAALATIRKADMDMVPDLIALLLDSDAELAQGARKTLERLTGEAFGPGAGDSPEERIAAAAEWRAWWRRQTEP
jgi:hypothetical protein